MENILLALSNPTDDDIQQMEALYKSIIVSKTFEGQGTSVEESESKIIEIQKQNNILNLLVQKCFEKIGADRGRYGELEKEIDALQQNVYYLQDENNYLQATNQEAFEKINRLEYVLDEVEASNEKLNAEVVYHKNEKKDLEVFIQKQRVPLRETSLNASVVEPNSLNVSTHSYHKETKRKHQAEVQVLMDALDSQSQTIDQLREEVEKYENMKSTYEDIKNTVANLLDAKFARMNGSSQGRPASEDKPHSHRRNHSSSVTPPSHSRARIDEVEGEENSNRNHLVGGSSRPTKKNSDGHFHRQSSLAEDLMATEIVEGQKQHWSCSSLEKGVEFYKKGKGHISTKKTAASLFDIENDKYYDQSPKYAGGSDLDDGYGDLYDRRIEDNEDDTQDKQKRLVSWLEVDRGDSPLSVRSRKSPRKLRAENRDSKEFKASELETTNTGTETKGDKSSLDSNERKDMQSDVNQSEVETKRGKLGSFSFGRYESKDANQEVDSKEAYSKLNKQVRAHIKAQKKDAKVHTKFSMGGIIRVLIFGAPKA